MNFFSYKTAAERYPQGRAFFHPLVIERIRAFLSLKKPVACAIDVGCGTGLSTIALKEIAEKIVGVDASLEMVRLAERDASIEYLIAEALELPFSKDAFDLMTLSSAFHWLEREKFLKESRRVLRRGGWLVVYDNYFSGQMQKENAAFQAWYSGSYLQRYPPPARAKLSFTEEDSGNEGLHLAGHEQYQNRLRFSIEGLTDYLTTQSNVIAAVEGGDEEIDEVRSWLKRTLQPLFGDSKELSFLFGGPVWYLQKRV
jgi:SAM-dependent methyltransferase